MSPWMFTFLVLFGSIAVINQGCGDEKKTTEKCKEGDATCTEIAVGQSCVKDGSKCATGATCKKNTDETVDCSATSGEVCKCLATTTTTATTKGSTEECSGHMVSDLSKTTHPTKCKQEVEGPDKKVAIHFGYDMTAKSINLCIVNTANANWVALGASKEDAKQGEGASFMKDNVISIYAEATGSKVYTLASGSLGKEKTDASGISAPDEKKTDASRTLCFKLAEANLKKADGQSSVNLAKASFIWAIGTSEVPTAIHSHKGLIQLNVMGSKLATSSTA